MISILYSNNNFKIRIFWLLQYDKERFHGPWQKYFHRVLNRISKLSLDLLVKHGRATKNVSSFHPGKFPVLCDHLFKEIIPDSKSYLERCSTLYFNQNFFYTA